MKYFYLLCILISLSLNLRAQELPIDFSDSSDQFTAFNGSGFAFNSDPTNSSNDVGQFFNNGSVASQGFFIDLAQPIDLSLEQQIKLSFYQFDPNQHSITLKLENGTASVVEVDVNTSGTGWSGDLIFDFSSATVSGTTNIISATGSYSRLTIFIDGSSTTPGTYLIDNITGYDDGTPPPDPNELDVIYDVLVWEDDFNIQGSVNSTNWYHQTQVIIPGVGWANGEEQHYTNRIDNSFVDNTGNLNIVAKKETFSDQGLTKEYTSARLNSKFAFTYGRVDVRAKLPFGNGTWPAIWTLGKNINEDGGFWDAGPGFTSNSVNWPACGEIDIMEHGLHSTNEVSSALHSPSSFGSTMNTATNMLSDVANNFHVYSMNWSPDEIVFLIDDIVFYRYNPSVKNSSTWPFDKEHYLLLNVAMGGVAGTIDPSFTESSMVIDYVRVYQNASLGLEDNKLKNIEVKTYPNPASNQINIQSDINFDSIRLYSVLGELVLETTGKKQIDVSKFSSGLYILKLNNSEKSISLKILID